MSIFSSDQWATGMVRRIGAHLTCAAGCKSAPWPGPQRIDPSRPQYNEGEFMTKLLAVCCIAVFAGFADQTSAREKEALKLVQTIPLPGVTGRLDHMGVDLEKKRLLVAAVANNTLEAVDLADGKVIRSIGWIKDTQDALILRRE